MIEFISTLVSHAPEWLSRLRPALELTLLLTLSSFALAIGIALLLELGRVSRWSALRKAVAAFIDIFRSVPILAVLYLIYFGTPRSGYFLFCFHIGDNWTRNCLQYLYCGDTSRRRAVIASWTG